MRRSQAVSSDVVEGRFQSRLRALHRQRLKTARTVLDDSQPQRYAHLDQNTKTVPREQVWRNRTIQHDNGLLVEKMVSILARKPKPNHDTELLTKAANSTVEDAYRPGPIPLPKSLNKDARTRQLEAIVLENEKFLSRLIASPGVYDRKQWDNQFNKEVKYMEQISRFPYQDPASCMPQVNPILAIAHAQSDRSAELILKQQQQAAQFSQTHTSLPPVPGSTPGFGSTQMSSTFGSTGGIPPYNPPPPGVTNHFPMPSSTSTGSSFPYLQPVPPPAVGGPVSKLRAQYTSQGVRVIKTGRMGGQPVRPGTSIELKPRTPLTPAAGGSHATPTGANTQRPHKYQPLRQQLQQQQQQQQQPRPPPRPSPLQPAATSVNPSAPAKDAEESKEPPVDGATVTAADSTGTCVENGNGSPAADGTSTSSPESDAESPPSSDSILKLFEDTLVISSRPVLIKIFECGGPWRFELRVFDPWSALEYTLSLPVTYVKLCFYQVPDLLLRTNRGFLLQTLLHYLAFSPGSDGSLELLVDIVAPPPRNPTEHQAWLRAHDQAALDQAMTELEAEKKAAAEAHQAEKEREAKEREFKEEENRRQQEEFERAKSDPAALAALTDRLASEGGQSNRDGTIEADHSATNATEPIESSMSTQDQQPVSSSPSASSSPLRSASPNKADGALASPDRPSDDVEKEYVIHRGNHANETHLLSPETNPSNNVPVSADENDDGVEKEIVATATDPSINEESNSDQPPSANDQDQPANDETSN